MGVVMTCTPTTLCCLVFQLRLAIDKISATQLGERTPASVRATLTLLRLQITNNHEMVFVLVCS
jgi:hypothetical protein